MIPSSAVPLELLPTGGASRINRDRLEIVTALIEAPSFDPLYRADVIVFPAHHQVYGWQCTVEGCQRVLKRAKVLCVGHDALWHGAKMRGVGRAEFLAGAVALQVYERSRVHPCRVCPDRPADRATTRLCGFHHYQWRREYPGGQAAAGFDRWVAAQVPRPGYGACRVRVCTDLARSPLGLCAQHEDRYRAQGRPGGATLPGAWANT